jgi:hypothetical protein
MDTSHVIDGGVGITVWSFLFAWTAFFVQVANVMQVLKVKSEQETRVAGVPGCIHM